MTTRSNPTLTVEAILAGTGFGAVQSVGQMEVIPILDEGSASDHDFAPPNISVGTAGYGHVRARNNNPDRPTILPMGAGFLTPAAAQDHAVLSAGFLKASENKAFDKAVCIQQTQGGLINQEDKNTKMIILPAPLRVAGLGLRSKSEFNRMWHSISQFNAEVGVPSVGNLIEFMKKYEKELDEFVAEFELVPRQIGAVVLLDGKVVGVERAPNADFWKTMFVPLIRGCYGGLAIKARKKLGNKMPPTRTSLKLREKSLTGLAAALKEATIESRRLVQASYDAVKQQTLFLPPSGKVEDKLGTAEILTVANPMLAGQIVTKGDTMPYVSMSAAGA